MMNQAINFLLTLHLLITTATGFAIEKQSISCHGSRICKSSRLLSQSIHDNDFDLPTDYSIGDSGVSNSATWESELNYLTGKMRLEEQMKKEFLKKKQPRFFSYEMCREWAISQNMWTTQEEWDEWISMGEKNASIVPSDPELVYTQKGTWISWDDFLGVNKS